MPDILSINEIIEFMDKTYPIEQQKEILKILFGMKYTLENIVYNDLIGKNYKVYIGKTKKGEIDFIAVKSNKIKYFQVCYKLDKEETIKREFEAFNCLDDDNDKYVISLDKKDYSKDGIKHLNIFDFLMNDEF